MCPFTMFTCTMCSSSTAELTQEAFHEHRKPPNNSDINYGPEVCIMHGTTLTNLDPVQCTQVQYAPCIFVMHFKHHASILGRITAALFSLHS